MNDKDKKRPVNLDDFPLLRPGESGMGDLTNGNTFFGHIQVERDACRGVDEIPKSRRDAVSALAREKGERS